jgi:hypothetical protein
MKNFVILVIGHRGGGKSTWLMRNIEEFRPFVLIDPLFDPKYQSLGCYQPGDLVDFVDFCETGRPERVYMSPNVPAFDLICGAALAKGELNLLIDEVDNYASTHNIGQNFKKVLKYGRHRSVNLVMIARRMKEINPLLRSQASRFVIFPVGAEDAQELRPHIGDEAFAALMELKKTEEGSEYIDFEFADRKFEKKFLPFVKSNPHKS